MIGFRAAAAAPASSSSSVGEREKNRVTGCSYTCSRSALFLMFALDIYEQRLQRGLKPWEEKKKKMPHADHLKPLI